MNNASHIHVCARCSVEHNSATTYDPPGWIWRAGRLYCDGCASLVTDPIDDSVPALATAAAERSAARDNVFAQANLQIEKMARELSPTQRTALLQLRRDGRGDYDPRLTAARKALHQKGLADSPVSLGFGRNMIACLQHPTALGRAVAACLQKEAA